MPQPSSRFQTMALRLMVAGYLPFIVLALTFAFWRDFPLGRSFLFAALSGYGAVILSFLGGIRWGAVLSAGRGTAALAASVLPSLAGWVALMLAPRAALILLIAGFTIQMLWDMQSAKSGQLPEWFGAYRLGISIAVVFALALAFATM